MRERVAGFLSGAPLLFLGVVLGIAVAFKVLVGALAGAPEATAAASVPHEAPASPSTGSPSAPAPAGVRGEPQLVDVGPTLVNGAGASPTMRPTAAPPAPPRRKPRTHGRR